MLKKLSKITLLFILSSLLLSDSELFSMTNYEIKEYCKKSKSFRDCFKHMIMKRKNLEEGKAIEIPVIPFKK